MHPTTALPHRLIRALPLGLLALLAACSTPPPPAPAPPGGPVSGTPTPPPAGSPSPSAPAPGGVKASYATDPRSYRRDAAAHHADHFRVGTTYGYDALRDGDTRLGLNFGAGYRLAPLHDDGVRRAGPVFRGELRVGQRLGERAKWTQRIQVEAGRDDTFVKQSIGLDVALWPEWTLETDAVIRHRPDADALRTAEGWLGIRRRF